MMNSRRSPLRWIPFLAILIALLWPFGVRQAGAQDLPIFGIPTVIDGDTIEVHGQRIVLYAIDAPEARQECIKDGKPWRCGQEAAKRLSDMIGRRPVRCERKDMDRHRRVLAICSVDEQDINEWMVSEGWAVAFRKLSDKYIEAEQQARVARRGIWASTFDMPWDWRKWKK